tara:strand:- start:18 stop:848 length:831 start_codon:yes stop_codon:yes gene_type:complete
MSLKPMNGNSFKEKINEMIKKASTQTNENPDKQFQNILNNMGLPQNKMNGIVKNLNSMITCDTDCQKRKKTDELRIKWIAAKKNLATAPSNVESTEKSYYVFDKGEVGYKKMLVDRYTKIANTKKAKAIKNHENLINELNTLVADYTAENTSAKKLKDFLKVRLDENKRITQLIDKNVALVQTNGRRVVYEDRAQDHLHSVQTIFIILYIILVVSLGYTGSFIKNKQYLTIRGFSQLVAVTIFPFMVYYIVLFGNKIYNKFNWYTNNKLPKDVYVE